MQTCNDDEMFDDCECDFPVGAATTSGSGAGASSTGAGASSGSGAGGGGGGGTGGASGVTLSAGDEVLVDVFVGDAGIYLVFVDEVRLVDSAGGVLATWPSERDITAAAFDGMHLGVADTAVLNMFEADLTPTVSSNLVQTCASAVLVSGPRFICGPENDWDRIFHTFDALTGDYLASSQEYTYNGIPMRRIPGTDEFVTVTTNLSPSDYHLYATLPNGEATYINESPYHGDFPVTDVYGFEGFPATHLITHTGLRLLIHGTDCAVGSSFGSECFIQDGVLGTLSGNQRFIGMESDHDGHLVYGLVDLGSSSYNSQCESGCIAQKIDIAQKVVLAQVTFTDQPGAVIATRHVPGGDAMVVGCNLPAESFSDPPPGHRVALIAF